MEWGGKDSKDFRPINSVGLYNILGRILANRLEKVVRTIVL